jgi:hypothetical protein
MIPGTRAALMEARRLCDRLNYAPCCLLRRLRLHAWGSSVLASGAAQSSGVLSISAGRCPHRDASSERTWSRRPAVILMWPGVPGTFRVGTPE